MHMARLGTVGARGTWGDAAIWSFALDKDGLDPERAGMLVHGERRSAGHGRGASATTGSPIHLDGGVEPPHDRVHLPRSAWSCTRGGSAWTRSRSWKELDAQRVSRSTRRTPRESRFHRGMRQVYTHIVFDEIELSTGRVYSEPCHRIMRHSVSLPNTDWVAENHWCVPALLPAAVRGRYREGTRHRWSGFHRLARSRPPPQCRARAVDIRPRQPGGERCGPLAARPGRCARYCGAAECSASLRRGDSPRSGRRCNRRGQHSGGHVPYERDWHAQHAEGDCRSRCWHGYLREYSLGVRRC